MSKEILGQDELNVYEQDMIFDILDKKYPDGIGYKLPDDLSDDELSDVINHFMTRTKCTKKQAWAVMAEHIYEVSDYMGSVQYD